MNKAFVKESDNDDDDEAVALAQAIPAGAKNYITPAGYKAIKDELLQLIDVDRPEVVRVVHWAASNGDRSENGDYIYGKRRLREIDRRIRFLEPMTAGILANRRRVPPSGLAGGGDALPGANKVVRADGSEQVLTATDSVDMHAGDLFVILTPGGGGYGKV